MWTIESKRVTPFRSDFILPNIYWVQVINRSLLDLKFSIHFSEFDYWTDGIVVPMWYRFHTEVVTKVYSFETKAIIEKDTCIFSIIFDEAVLQSDYEEFIYQLSLYLKDKQIDLKY